MFTILEDTTRAGLIEKLEDLERNCTVKAFDFSVGKEFSTFDGVRCDKDVFTALVQYEVRSPYAIKPQPRPSRGW